MCSAIAVVGTLQSSLRPRPSDRVRGALDLQLDADQHTMTYVTDESTDLPIDLSVLSTQVLLFLRTANQRHRV